MSVNKLIFYNGNLTFIVYMFVTLLHHMKKYKKSCPYMMPKAATAAGGEAIVSDGHFLL